MRLPALVLLAASALLTLTGCPKKPAVPNESIPLTEGVVRAGVYTHPGFGWSMKIPDGWRVKTKDEVSATRQKGLDAVQKNVDGPIDMTSTIELLYMQRDQFNQFTSTADAFDPAKDGSYADNQQDLVQVILKTYADTGMKVRHELRTEVIGGVKFNVMDATLLSPDGEKVILHQRMYDALFGTRSLTVSLNWNNDTARDALVQAWSASTFSTPSAPHP
ncbi:hypothetical protein CMV30_17450 [Nibricoccus aquaticus]|uniref:Lipoprotein n=1 Tax=Nibricoccus aquaticus TaxID=2576891 RepID=A0A290QJS7_9BACT|nr:hypothetical protein [Nibricoccus aquaticus]ATC65588.1 hypothetical protein CMV30_17450 [Nibricoccus aquaticus]